MTLIDKAEALLPCPFCGGKAELNDCLVECMFCLCAVPNGFGYEGERLGYATEAEAIAAWNRRAALPARGVRVKPLVWEPMRVSGLHAFCPVFKVLHYADDADDAAKQDAERSARILAALEPAPTDAAQVREAALRDAADVVDAKLMRWGFPSTDGCRRDEMRTAILALIGETPHEQRE